MGTKRKLTVGLVFDDSLDRPDGVQQYVQRVAEWLTSQGHDVHFLVGETIRTDLKNMHSLSRNLRVKFNGNTMSMPLPTTKKELKKVLADYNFDILHVQMPYSPFMAGRLMKMVSKQTAVVGTFHILPYSKLVLVANRILGWVNWRSGKRLTTVMAVSPPAQIFARKLYGYECQIVPNPIRVRDFMGTSATQEHAVTRIVFLGRLVERKGARHLLEAVAYLREQHLYDGPFEVVIGGKGELYEQLQHFVRQNGLKDVVRFPGFVPETDKAALLATADIAVFPSVSGESFGISLLEAMAASPGVVLAGNNPGYASVMHGLHDRLVEPLDTPAFAQSLADWLGNAANRTTAATEQQKYVQQYDVAIVGAQIETVYEQALQTKR